MKDFGKAVSRESILFKLLDLLVVLSAVPLIVVAYLATTIAAFPYERGNEARTLASISPSENNYLSYFQQSWKWPVMRRHRQHDFKKKSIPIYHEIIFLDVEGNEKINRALKKRDLKASVKFSDW
jgi:hypothetical protein